MNPVIHASSDWPNTAAALLKNYTLATFEPMTPIEQAARELANEIWKDVPEDVLNNGLNIITKEPWFPEVLAIITRHLPSLTKPLEDENKRLREALEGVTAAWERHSGRIIESRGGLDNDNRVNEVNDSIENAAKALTKPT